MSNIVKGENIRKPYTFKYRDDQGKQREKSFSTKREAEDFKTATDHSLKSHSYIDTKNGKTTFGEYAAKWVNEYPCAEQTRKGLRLTLGKHLAPLHNMTLTQVASAHEQVSTLLQVTIPANAPTVVKRARTIILAVLDLAVVQSKIVKHNLATIQIATPGRTRKPFILATKAQLQIMADGMSYGMVVWLMHGLGLRIEEALAVNINNFRDDGTVYRVTEQANRSGSKAMPLKARRAGEFRDVPVPAWLWVKVQAVVPDSNGYLMTGTTNILPAYGSVYESFKRYAVKAGIAAGFTPHSVRHGYASTLLAARVPITDLAKGLGHRDIRETFDTYGHLVPSAWSAGRDALDKAWND